MTMKTLIVLAALATMPAYAQDPYAQQYQEHQMQTTQQNTKLFLEQITYASFARKCRVIGDLQEDRIVENGRREFNQHPGAWDQPMRDAAQAGENKARADGCDYFKQNPDAVNQLRDLSTALGVPVMESDIGYRQAPTQPTEVKPKIQANEPPSGPVKALPRCNGHASFDAQGQLNCSDKLHTRLRSFCSPHHQDSALHPSIAQLERAAGFRREDTAEQRLDKLEAVLAQGTSDLNEAVPLLADLLSIPTGDRYRALNLTPQKAEGENASRAVGPGRGMAARQPVLMAFEDIHWSDPTTRESLDLLVDRVSTLRALAVLTFRPEFTPPWIGRPQVTLLTLNRLPPRQRAEMIAHVTGGKTLPKGDCQPDRRPN